MCCKRLAIGILASAVVTLASLGAWAQAGYTSYGSVQASPPTYSAGTYKPFTLDTSGRMLVTVSGTTYVSYGNVLAALPTYTTGTTQPFTMDTSGRIAVISYQSTSPWVVNTVTTSATTNSAAVITTGGTFQTVLASNAGRKSLTVANNNAAHSCWVYLGSGVATASNSILLLAGAVFQRTDGYTPTDAVQATCSNNNDTLYVDYQ